jgi:hypothetical protein
VQRCGEGSWAGIPSGYTGSSSGVSHVRGSGECGGSGSIAVAMAATPVAVSSAAVTSEAAVKVAVAEETLAPLRKWKRPHWMRRKKDWIISFCEMKLLFKVEIGY